MSEVRPIDANALRKALKCGAYSSVLKLIDRQPTLDYEPVVRCKDCKHRNKEYSETFCEVLGRLTNDNFYCSYGAKMDEEVK